MFKITTAQEILQTERNLRPIITLCKKLDDALGDGILMGLITEFSGAPGTGKTQFCFQLCVNVQIPRSIGGIGGKAVFIDTNQDFCPFRLREIATSSSRRYQQILKVDFSVEQILSGISYYYCGNVAQLQAVIEDLKKELQQESDIKLIAIDSICYPFRITENYADRTQKLFQLLTDLQILADKHELAVVLTNDLTTRFYENKESYVTPSLGDSFGHKIGQRIILTRNLNTTGHYIAYLEKTMLAAPQNIPFKISNSGIRGVD